MRNRDLPVYSSGSFLLAFCLQPPLPVRPPGLDYWQTTEFTHAPGLPGILTPAFPRTTLLHTYLSSLPPRQVGREDRTGLLLSPLVHTYLHAYRTTAEGSLPVAPLKKFGRSHTFYFGT